ncbi:hypothetical protein EDB80DRAFT_674807 [Ilyonectria destructans]|nr:hypothetical protein EDB80DRAFT_674807 [Ilyonectria destructans]
MLSRPLSVVCSALESRQVRPSGTRLAWGRGQALLALGSQTPWAPGLGPAIGWQPPLPCQYPCSWRCSNGPILIPRRDGNQNGHPCSRQALQSVGPAAPTASARANVSSHVVCRITASRLSFLNDTTVPGRPPDRLLRPQPYRHAL